MIGHATKTASRIRAGSRKNSPGQLMTRSETRVRPRCFPAGGALVPGSPGPAAPGVLTAVPAGEGLSSPAAGAAVSLSVIGLLVRRLGVLLELGGGSLDVARVLQEVLQVLPFALSSRPAEGSGCEVGHVEPDIVRRLNDSLADGLGNGVDRKSTRLNSSHLGISYAV